MAFDGREAEYETAELWNALCESSTSIQEDYHICVNAIVEPLATYLEGLISLDDETLMSRPRKSAVDQRENRKTVTSDN